MKKILFSVILAVAGLMTTTNAQASTTVSNDDDLRFVAQAIYITELDENGNQVEGSAQAVEAESTIVVSDEAIVINMAGNTQVLKITEAEEPKTDDEGSTIVVLKAVDDEGEAVQVAIVTSAEGEINITVHGDGHAVAFLKVSMVE